MKKIWLLFGLVFVLAIPQYSVAQSTEDQIRTIGTGIGVLGKMIDNGINKRRERERREEEMRKEDERLRKEQQEWLEQREAAAREERRKAEEERRKAEEERKKTEEESLTITSFQEYWLSDDGGWHEFTNYNGLPLITKGNLTRFYTKKGVYVTIWLQDKHPCYFNSDNKERRFSCNKVIGRIKYYGDDSEYTLEDSFSFIMLPQKDPQKGYLMDYKDIFPHYSISSEDLEYIWIYFVEDVRIQ